MKVCIDIMIDDKLYDHWCFNVNADPREPTDYNAEIAARLKQVARHLSPHNRFTTKPNPKPTNHDHPN